MGTPKWERLSGIRPAHLAQVRVLHVHLRIAQSAMREPLEYPRVPHRVPLECIVEWGTRVLKGYSSAAQGPLSAREGLP